MSWEPPFTRWLLAAAIATALPASLHAYRCSRVPPDGPSLFWESREVPYAINPGGFDDEAKAAITQAIQLSFQTWQDVTCCDVTLPGLGTTDEPLAGYDWRHPEKNLNLMVWRNGGGDLTDAWPHEYGSIAVTTTTFNSRTGELLDADIEFNGVTYQFTTCTPPEVGCHVAYDVQNTATHEIGHLLGLDHPPPTQRGVEETTMYASAPRGEIKKRDLDEDDIAGLCAIYPAGQATVQCFPAEPAAGPEPRFSQIGSNPDTGCVCGAGAGTSGWTLCLAAFALFLRRHSRRMRC